MYRHFAQESLISISVGVLLDKALLILVRKLYTIRSGIEAFSSEIWYKSSVWWGLVDINMENLLNEAWYESLSNKSCVKIVFYKAWIDKDKN